MMESKIKNRFSERLLIILVILNLISFSHIKLFNLYTSGFFYLNLLLIVLGIFIQNRFFIKDFKVFLFISIFLIYGMATLFITEGSFGSIVAPFYSIIVYFYINRTYISENKTKHLLVAMIALNLFLVINSKGYYLKFLFNRDSYINSNIMGMIMLYTTIYSIAFIKKMNKRKFMYLVPLLYILSLYGILNFQSRTSLISLLMFFFLDNLIPKKFWKRKKFTLSIFILTIVSGVLIPYIYVRMFNSGINFELPFINKTLYTGREIIWSNFYNAITENNWALTFGLGSNADLWTGHDLNLHNNYLGVISNFGIIGFLLYYGFWITQIINFFRQKVIESYQVSFLLGFLIVLINGYFEISTLWYVMFFMNFMYLGFAVNKRPNQELRRYRSEQE